MGIFDKLKNKSKNIEQDKNLTEVTNSKEIDNYNLVEINNYVLADIRKENLSTNSYSLTN